MDSINSELGGQEMIFLPDNAVPSSAFVDLVCRDLGFEAIKTRIAEKLGPPARTFSDLAVRWHNEDYDGYVCYGSLQADDPTGGFGKSKR